MSTLTDLIAKAQGQHRAVRDTRGEVKSCTCGVVTWAIQKPDAPQFEQHQGEAIAAVVADWLDGLADEHNAKIALIAGVEFQPRRRDTSTAHGMRRAAAEARKGADQ